MFDKPILDYHLAFLSRVLGYCILAVGVPVLVVWLYWRVAWRRLDATITDIREGSDSENSSRGNDTYTWTLSYVDDDGRRHEGKPWRLNPFAWSIKGKIGQVVPIMVHPHKPEVFQHARGGWGITVIGLFFFALGKIGY